MSLYEDFNKMVSFNNDQPYRDDQYTYYPYAHAEGEPAYTDENGLVHYRVPNNRVGVNGLLDDMTSWIQSPNNYANRYDRWSNQITDDYLRAQQAGLDKLAEGARNVFDRSRAYAGEVAKKYE